ncbi:Na+/alanine symporter [Bibersteinia trehalosi USDA-ARS-USMARC-188]|uniref:Na+/alanine symporter n=4 Tax=Bibersteinia trehalosi TaxID=47735 RepID=W0R607_BIBTR|nr:alanine/glycine:cation symporter family protein [Bibersteinia trehalosi]AGH38193.1 Na+/alanine symporter [Bibersteinia trehalosi USDA-ARS-USMARC-192]AHG82006.1 Na+/alanine symporter [Bibersteinia trehalosi USDA-ARS-USMARC-188]AHG84312.1 Na+/alanine symporter [Bibersteinia trehalosi USDA-ARS-USMARC-189]AHG86181.1 Na+/alanine symporter [Bibersteinia trehalosi USDA-ARS-USMARC-190]RRN01050.1 alanine:cation symporter family protein [Bibersteinia trehalosi]
MESIVTFFESILTWVVNTLDGPLWDITVITLLGVGLFFTVTTGLVQLRLLPRSLREMWSGRSSDGSALTPFQAFATGLASRVGVGNIGGVATAIALGGPGAVFWMWITALIGMSSAFAESSLAQAFKIRDPDGMFRGGPAYYITKGLKAHWLAVAFATTLIFTFGFAFNAVQANSIVEASSNAWGWNANYVGIVLVALTALIIFGGVKRIGQVASKIVPTMASFYLIIAVIILGMNIGRVPEILSLIVRDAFDFSAMAGGMFGAIFSKAMLLGVKRGLFSNEAGMGSAPNSAAASDAKHPASQGLIQMLGVFVDTIVVCTCTAIIILMSNDYGGESLRGVSLTQKALEFHLGEFGLHFLAFVLLLFCYSSIIGNYAYAETNIRYIRNKPGFVLAFRLVVLFFVYFGAVRSGGIVWDFADTVMASMAMINLVAIIILAPIVWVILKDYMKQVRAGVEQPVFDVTVHPELIKRGVDPEIWKSRD